ncbi:MAG: mucoidy inhibitor MuiA family protein [Chloroflexi bacterium]|nr:mucoidy inhibitor MuiA family protein [Chloroflexota bacterium]
MSHPSTISHVTVFKDRARLTRLQRVTLEAGAHKVEFSDLPLSLLAASLRASGKGTAKAKLLGVTSRQENYLETPVEAARELENQIQKIEDSDAELLAKIGVLEKERVSLDALAAQSEMWARGIALRNRDPKEQGAVFDFISDRNNTINEQKLKMDRERREMAKELDRLRRELKGAQSARPKQRYVATVEVEVSRAGDLDVELTYMVTGAGWSPLYDLRLKDSLLEVTYLAQVTQNTGEDWNNVALTLSTAQPSLSLTIPEMDAWYIAQRYPVHPAPQPPRAKSAPMFAAAPAPMSDRVAGFPEAAREEPEATMEMESATVSESGMNLSYSLSSRADVPGNNDPRKVVIASFNLKPNFDYVTAPKIESVCFRRAKVKNESAYSMLKGNAQLFEGDDYLGATTLEFVAPNQEFELALGADERLRVERELTLREVDKNFMGDKRRIHYGYKIEIENLRDTPQTIFARDHVPVPRDEQIKVKLEASEPKVSEQSDLNQLEWKITLNANSKQTIKYEFSVEHPRSMDVVGLP